MRLPSRFFVLWFLGISAFSALRSTAVAQEIQNVGIRAEYLNYVYSEQQQPQWCWAAGIQMILNYYNVNVTQRDIVYRTYGLDRYGRLPNYAANYETITANLNTVATDRLGRRYRVVADMFLGPPRADRLVQELANGYPVLVGYKTGRFRGHAVVVTAASFLGSLYDPVLYTFTVRDPYPTSDNLANRGRRVYWGDDMEEIEVHWYIRVERF